MCSFAGFCNLTRDISSSENINTLKVLTSSLSYRGPDKQDLYISKHMNLGYRRLIIFDNGNINQPISYNYNNNIYTIICNGQLYNLKDIRNELINLGYEFKRIF